MSTEKVKIILHLLLMSDLHAFTILAYTRNFRTFVTKYKKSYALAVVVVNLIAEEIACYLYNIICKHLTSAN